MRHQVVNWDSRPHPVSQLYPDCEAASPGIRSGLCVSLLLPVVISRPYLVLENRQMRVAPVDPPSTHFASEFPSPSSARHSPPPPSRTLTISCLTSWESSLLLDWQMTLTRKLASTYVP